MIEKPEQARARLLALASDAWAASAIGFFFESGLAEHLGEPRSIDDLAKRVPGHSASRIAAVLGVTAQEGFVVCEGDHYRLAPGVAPLATGVPRVAVQGDIRANLMQMVAFLDSARNTEPSVGWHHTSAQILQAQGDASCAFAGMLKAVLPLLGDASERLEHAGASFLDIGVGVGAISIAVCRAYPHMRAVGLDVHEPALEIARANVMRAGLDTRVELRRQLVEDLRDEAVFDLAWVPAFFLPKSCLADALARVYRSLRPGGWMIVGAGCRSPDTDPRIEATYALVTDLWGGAMHDPADLEQLLTASGLIGLARAPGPPGPMSLWFGRRG